MKQSRSTPFRLLLGPPVIAMGLAAALAYLLSDKQAAPGPAPGSGEPDPGPPVAAAPVPPPRRAPPRVAAPPLPVPAAVPPRPVSPPAAPTAQIDPNTQHAQAMLERFKEPALREHAQLMVVENAKFALGKRKVAQLKQLQNTLRAEGLDQIVSPDDATAIDIGVECLTQGGNGRQRAADFIEDNPSSPLAESLHSACQ
jgi:hypothetical protein